MRQALHLRIVPRQLPPALVALVFIAACQRTPAASTATPQHESGKIPITASSPAASEHYLSGRSLNESLKPFEAHEEFQRAVTADSAFALGEYALAATSPTAIEASAHLTRARSLAEHASAGEQLLIQVFEARSHGNPALAQQLADSLVARYPNDERAHWTRASAYSAQQQYDTAIAALRRAIALNPTYSLAVNQLGYAYRAVGQWAAAESTFKQYIALAPNDPNPYDSYGELLMKLGRFDESIAQYRKAQRIDEHFTGAFSGIAANEMYAGRHDASIVESSRYLALARDDRERRSALQNMAMTYVDEGDTPQALKALDQRLTIARVAGDSVSMAGDLCLMADVLLEAGRATEARTRYASAHALIAASGVAATLKADDALAAHYDAARVALATNDAATAEREARAYDDGAMAAANVTRQAQAHELKGLVALAAKQFDTSLSELAKADPQNPAVLYAMSRAYEGRGDRAQGESLRREAAQLNILPTFPYVFTRAALAKESRAISSRSATSRTVRGTPH